MKGDKPQTRQETHQEYLMPKAESNTRCTMIVGLLSSYPQMLAELEALATFHSQTLNNPKPEAMNPRPKTIRGYRPQVGSPEAQAGLSTFHYSSAIRLRRGATRLMSGERNLRP